MTTSRQYRLALLPPGLDPRAACAGTDPDLWFPLDGERTAEWETRARDVQVVCVFQCSIRSECLEWALETRQAFGVWGGLTERERVALRRRRESEGVAA